MINLYTLKQVIATTEKLLTMPSGMLRGNEGGEDCEMGEIKGSSGGRGNTWK